MRRILAGVLAALIASVAVAQSVNTTAAISWVAPTNDSNGFPLAGSPNAVTSYNVYVSTSALTSVPTSAPLATVTAPATTVTGSVTATIGSTLYVYVTACNPTGCSVLPTPATKLVTAPAAPPGTPTNVMITVTITAH